MKTILGIAVYLHFGLKYIHAKRSSLSFHAFQSLILSLNFEILSRASTANTPSISRMIHVQPIRKIVATPFSALYTTVTTPSTTNPIGKNVKLRERITIPYTSTASD